MPFRKGDPNINRTGLNRGCYKALPWYNLQRLANMADDILPKLAPEKRIQYILAMQTLLVGKLAAVPKTPQESVDNVSEEMKAKQELDQAEANDYSQSGSDRTGME